MPMYDFHCKQCNYIFDKLIPMDQRDVIQVCPQCGGEAHRKPVNTFSATTSTKNPEPLCHHSSCCSGCKK